jgi:DNA-directed RNA polymerase specialized sigma24 family protein
MDPMHRAALQRIGSSADAVVLAELRRYLAADARLSGLLCGLLWQRHERTLDAYVRRLGRDVADDALGDVQVRFVRWCYGTAPLSADTMLPIARTMAKRAVADVIRRRQPSVPLDDVDAVDGDDVLDRLADVDALEAILRRVAPRDRRIIEAMLDDVPDADLAAELGIEPNALYVARHRALARLRSTLEGER